MAEIRILVVDDDEAMTQLITEQLRDWCYDAASARSVEQAMRVLTSDRFDLLLSDLHMRDRDGFELLALAQTRWPDMGTILMSSFPARETEGRALRAGALAFLSKPFSMRLLRSTLDRIADPAHPPVGQLLQDDGRAR